MTDHGQDEREAGAGRDARDDDFEMHVEEMRQPAGDADGVGDATSSDPAPVSPRGDRFRVARLTLYAVAVVAVVVFGLAPGGGLSRVLGSMNNALSGFGSVYPTPTLPEETPAEIGSAPLTCAPLTTAGTGGIGGSPVWVSGFEGSMKDNQASLYVSHGSYTRYGWKRQFFIDIEPGVTGKVFLRGERLSNGTPLWMEVIEQGQMYTNIKPIPKALLILDPKEPGLAPFQNNSMGLGDDWAVWVGAIYIPAAGCYALDASWPGGSWRVTFAAGL